MKNKFLNKLLIATMSATLLFGAVAPVHATEASTVEETVVSEDDVLQSEESEEITDDTQNLDESESELEVSETEETTEIPAESKLYVDGKEYSGNVSIKLNFIPDGKSSLTAGTKFIITFESRDEAKKGFKQEVTVTSKTINSGVEVILPVDEYWVSTKSSLNGAESAARLIYNSELENQTALIIEDDQELTFTLEGDVKSEQITDSDTPEEEPEENFLWSLLKNNIIFLVMLLGCGIALLVYRLKQDNQ